jgi:fibronectin-binding autotransporter adhesin
MRHLFDRFLTKFNSTTAAPRHSGRAARRNSPDRKLKLEHLEDRRVLSTLTVVSNLDNGSAGTLRAEIAQASSGDTIVFASSVHNITLSSQLVVSKNLSIQGPGANRLTISGNNSSRIFDVNGSAYVQISGVTLTQGRETVSVEGDGGGAILNETGSTLVLSNVSVVNNQAVAAAYGVDVLGGGVLNTGSITIKNCVFDSNSCTGGGGSGTFAGGSAGGGVDNEDGTLTVTGSTFTGNEVFSAAVQSGGYNYATGGGLMSEAGVIPNDTNAATATISNSTFTNNMATGGNSVDGEAGGLCNQSAIGTNPQLATMTINNSTFASNQAVGGPDGVGSAYSGAIGGGILNAGVITINGSTIENNQAKGGQGSVPSVGGFANPATGAGQAGGISNDTGVMTINNCLVTGNQAIGANTTSGPGCIATGGGIDCWGVALAFPGILTVNNSTITGNQAIAGSGGPGSSATQIGFAAGGGVDIAFSSVAKISNSTVGGNTVTGSSAGSGVNGGTADGAGICLGFSVLYSTAAQPIVDNSTLQLSNSTVQGNVALGGQAGAATASITPTAGNAFGGGLAINAGCSATVTNSTFNKNVANGSETVLNSGQPIGGGGIENEGTLKLSNSTVSGNQAVSTAGNDISGGGLLNNRGQATIQNSTFDGDQALGGGSYSAVGGSTGGGIASYDGTLSLTNSAITNNQAISAATPAGATLPYFALGGGLANYGDANPAYGTSSTVTITNCTVANNLATGGDGDAMNGGGIFQENETFGEPYSVVQMTISNSNIDDNLAQGGANGAGSTSEFGDAIGGGVMNGVGILTINNSTLRGNEAIGGNGCAPVAGGYASPANGAGQGGGLVNFGGQTSVTGCNLIGNRAIGGNSTTGPGAIADGGGIANWGKALGIPQATLMVTNSTLSGNEAIAGQGAKSSAGYSGAVWGFAVGGAIDDSFSGSATVTNCNITGNEAIGSNGVNGGTGFGGGIGLGFSNFFSTPGSPVVDNATLQLNNSTLTDNIAQGGAGGSKGTAGNGLGGGLAINYGSTVTTTSDTIDFNMALGGSGKTAGQGIGGGVYNNIGNSPFAPDALTAIDFNFASTMNFNVYN